MSALLSALGSFLVSFLATVARDALSDWRSDNALVDLGRAQAERDDAVADAAAAQEMAIIAGRHDSRDDVLARLDGGSA